MLNRTVLLFCSLLSICLCQIKVTILTNYLDCRQIYHDHGDYDYQYKEFYEVIGPSLEPNYDDTNDYDKVTELASEPDDNILNFKFAIKVSSDVHILLATYNSSEHKTISDAVYEIAIRFRAGRYNLINIRKIRSEERTVVSESETVKIRNFVQKLRLRPLWIRISKNGVITMGKERNETALISWTDPDPKPIPVNVVSFSARVKNESTFYFDCPKADDILPQLPPTTVHIPSTPELVESALWLLPAETSTKATSYSFLSNTTLAAETIAKSSSNSAFGTTLVFFRIFFISFAFLIYN